MNKYVKALVFIVHTCWMIVCHSATFHTNSDQILELLR